MNFLFQGIMIVVSSTAPITLSGVPDAIGCYDMPTNKIYVMPEYKNDEFVLYHEIGHYKYHKYFFGENAKAHFHFWEVMNKKTGYDVTSSPAWEIVANHYALSKQSWNRQKMPKEVIKYFNFYGN